MNIASRRRARSLMAIATLACLSSCGGGGTTGAVVTVPAPSPTSTPTPPPTPTPASTVLTFVTPYVAREMDGTGGRRISDAQLDNGARLILTEPDVTSAAVIENVTFNGNEAYEVTQPSAPGSYTQRFNATSFTGRGANYFAGAGPERVLPQLTHQNAGISVLVLPQLEEVRKTAATAASTGNVTDHVRLADVRIFGTTGVADHRGLQLFGTRPGAGYTAATGSATFVGEVFGDAFLSGVNQDCVGDAVITVDYARGTVTGQITISQYLGTGAPKGTLTVEFAADIVDEEIVSRTLTIRGDNVLEAGTLRGGFYGPAGDEIGLVFSASGAAGNFIGGLVAGKE
jgi:hypothetical protein